MHPLCVSQVFFFLSDLMLTTSHLARRAIAGFLVVITLLNWLTRTFTVEADESSIDLLTPLRGMMPTSVNPWTAQEVLKTLDYGLLTCLSQSIYLTYKQPDLVVFMPMRFVRAELHNELKLRRERRAAQRMARAERHAGPSSSPSSRRSLWSRLSWGGSLWRGPISRASSRPAGACNAAASPRKMVRRVPMNGNQRESTARRESTTRRTASIGQASSVDVESSLAMPRAFEIARDGELSAEDAEDASMAVEKIATFGEVTAHV